MSQWKKFIWLSFFSNCLPSINLTSHSGFYLFQRHPLGINSSASSFCPPTSVTRWFIQKVAQILTKSSPKMPKQKMLKNWAKLLPNFRLLLGQKYVLVTKKQPKWRNFAWSGHTVHEAQAHYWGFNDITNWWQIHTHYSYLNAKKTKPSVRQKKAPIFSLGWCTHDSKLVRSFTDTSPHQKS